MAIEHLIQVENISKEYAWGGANVSAIKQMDFSIDDGEFISVIGQSGSGKSTLLSILGGLNRPSGGNVFIDTLNVYDLSSEQRADFRSEYIGIIFQSFQLIPYLTVLENVMLPMTITRGKTSEKREQAAEVLEKVSLTNKANRLPARLSGGEQERVAIARAIVNKPPILLADEPTGNLDSHTANEVMELLKQLNDMGQTIIMVTHNPQMCSYTHRTINVKDGKCDFYH